MHIKLNQFILILTLVFISKEINAVTIINTSTSINQSLLDSYSWPVTINGGTNGSPVVITLDEDVILSNAQNYFILNGNYINFNGNNHKITISGINGYVGLIKNGSYVSSTTIVNGFSNINILNTIVNSINSDLAGRAGWIGQSALF